jgi:hypothetical protein
MTSGMESLLLVLRKGNAASTLSPSQLQDAFDRADTERVLPLFLSRVRSENFVLPQDFELQCSAVERAIAVSTFWWTSQLKEILQAFTAEAIQVILLKGPCMAERLYGRAGLRTSRDLDLLVRHQDLTAAGNILVALGFVRGDDDEGRHQSWVRDATLVELHFDLARRDDLCLDLDRIFANAVLVTFAGQAAHILSASDELLFLCVHGIKHSYEQLGHVIDVALALKSCGPRSTFAVFTSDAEFVEPILALGYAMARKLYPLELPVGPFYSPKVLKQIEPIAQTLWSRVGSSNMQSRRCRPRRLFFALRPTHLSRMRYLWFASGAANDEDRALAARLHVRNRLLTAFVRRLRLVSESFGTVR